MTGSPTDAKYFYAFLMLLANTMKMMLGVAPVCENWPMAILRAMTGQISLFQLFGCREAGFDDYFPKPVSRDLLVSAAKTAFEKQARWRKG